MVAFKLTYIVISSLLNSKLRLWLISVIVVIYDITEVFNLFE